MNSKFAANIAWILWGLWCIYLWFLKPDHEGFWWQFWLTGYSNFLFSQAIQRKTLYVSGPLQFPYPDDWADKISYYFTAVIGWVIYLIAKFV